MRAELNRIIEEREAELVRIEQKEREVDSLKSELSGLESELASTVAKKEAQV